MTPFAWLATGVAVLLVSLGSSARTRTVTADRGVLDPRLGSVPVAVVAVAAMCLVVGGLRSGVITALVACPAVVFVLRRLSDRPRRATADPALPLCLDLTSAALRAGRPLPDALMLAAPAASDDVSARLMRIASLLRLGAEPAVTWDSISHDGPLQMVAVAAARSSESGIKLADAFDQVAARLREERRASAAARANRAGVHAMAPLAACFLPSFVCLGVVPVVVGVAGSVFGAVG